MTTKQNEFIIGIMISFAIILLVAATLWLGKSNFLSKGMQLNLMVENADGIQNGDEIYFSGIKIGNVLENSIIKKGVLLKLKIDEFDKIPRDSKFEIIDFSLISGKVIQITPGILNEYFLPGDTVKGYSAFGFNDAVSDLKDLKPKVTAILSNIDSLTGNTFQKKLYSTLSNMDATISELKTIIDGNLKNSLANIDEITASNKEGISSLITSLSDRSEELSVFLENSSQTAEQLDTLLTNLNRGNGTLGSLMKDDSLYHNLNRTVVVIDSLINDLKNHPDKYISVSVF